MRKTGYIAASAVLILAAVGCQQDTSKTNEKISQIDKRLGNIEKLIKSGVRPAGARGRQAEANPRRRARPPGPNPADTYSVSIAGSAWEGTEHAKVTVVEGFEFA